MTRMRVLAGIAVAASLAAAHVPSARGQDGAAADTFRRAELAERSLGDLARAADLYRESARTSADAEARAVAELRAAHCLRRLGRVAEARALAAPIAAEASGVPAEVRRAAEEEIRALDVAAPPGGAKAPAAPEPRLADHELEREETRRALESVLERAKGYEAEIELLANRVRELNAEIERRRREEESAADPKSAEEVLELRRRELERRRRQDEQIARAFLKTARLLHQEGQFSAARACLYDALELDPENAEARALLDRVSAPLGDREALFQKTLEVLALAREVRAARGAAEVASLVDEGRRRQSRGDWLGSSAPLEQALAALDASSARGVELRGGAAAREEVLRLLQAATSRGVPRSPAPQPAEDAPEERWRSALRDLLAGAGSEVAQGLEMRFHDLGPVVAATALPPVPVGRGAEGWTISVRGPDPPALLAARLRADEARAVAAPGASFRVVGETLVALVDRETHRRLADRLASLRLASPPAAEVRVQAWRIDAAAVAAVLSRRGVAEVPCEGDARAASLAPGDADALVAAAAEAPSLGVATLRGTSLRAFRMTTGSLGASFVLDLLPAAGDSPGVGLRVETSVSRDRGGSARLRSSCLAGGSAARGGGVVVFGVADPSNASREVAVLVRIGEAAATAPSPPALAPLGHGSSDLPLPPHVAAVEDPPATAELVPDHPWPTRREAFLRRLRARARGASLVEVREDGVLVVGPDEARRGVGEFLAQIGAARLPQAFEVRVHQVPLAVEERVVATAPRLAPAPSGAFAWCVLRNETERRPIDLLVAATKGEVALLDPVVAAPATGRCDAVRILRNLYRSGPGVAPPGVPGFGRGEAAWVEEGLQLSIRPFGRTADGRADLDFGARARWVSDRGLRDAETAEGPVRVLEPTTASWWGDLSTSLGRGESLLLARARSPFAQREGTGEADRLVVLVRPLE